MADPDRPVTVTGLGLRDLLELRSAAPADVADDGRTLLVESDLPGTTQLFRLAPENAGLEQLTGFAEPVHGAFVPGTRRILLQMDAGGNERTQLYLLDATPGAEPQPLVVDPRFIHRMPELSRDGTLLAYVSNRRNGVDFDVYVHELATGDERCVFDTGGLCDTFAFSPDAQRLVVSRESNERSSDNDLYLVDVRSAEATRVTPHDEPAVFGYPHWLPDGGSFFAASNDERNVAAVARYDVAERSWRTAVESDRDLDCTVDDAGRHLLVIENADGFTRLELREARTLAPLGEVPLPGRGVADRFRFSADGTRLYFTFTSPREPGDVWAYDVAAGALERLTDVSAGFAKLELVEPELHRFDSFDGESIPVFLWRPRGRGPFPVLIAVHGGPEAQFLPAWLPSFTPLIHHLVSRGFAVAAPNVRGSTGYGKRYEHLDDVERRLDSVRDLAALHDWLATQPDVDASRTVVYGRSYGGYMVLAALAFHPERWAAGVEAVGISNLVTFLENTSPWRRAFREREYGTLARDREFLERASPLTHVDRIRAPLFIQHGANDPRVPLSEAQQIHRVLTEKGLRCELVVYEDEGHIIGKLGNRIDAFERAVAFLDEVL